LGNATEDALIQIESGSSALQTSPDQILPNDFPFGSALWYVHVRKALSYREILHGSPPWTQDMHMCCRRCRCAGMQVMLGVRVYPKVRVGFFGLIFFRVFEIRTRSFPQILETRRFGYPKVRVRVRVIPKYPTCIAVKQNPIKQT
jgi:hypothetical protein